MDHLQTVQQIFTARFLRVPDYQRGYAWEKKHWEAMLEDLDVLEPGAEHYTGTLVLHRKDGEGPITDEEGREHGVYDVVDGQQRLTTIVLLLDAIRRELPSDSKLAEGIQKTYVLTRDLAGANRPKLTLNRDTHGFFERNVIADRPSIEGAQIRSQRLLKEAHNHLREHLRRAKERQTDGTAWLVELHKKVTNGFKLTVYEVPRASEVGVIFEVMNNRGKPLSEMEKVKNYLLYLVSKASGPAARELGDRINDTWRTIFEGLMESGASTSFYEDQLLRAHWLAAYDYRPKSWSGNDSIKERFPLRKYRGAQDQLIADVDGYVKGLRDFSLAYCDLIAPRRSDSFIEYREEPTVRQDLQRAADKLVRLDALATFLPLLGAVRIACAGDHATYLRFLTIAERYAFRVYRWAKKRANAGQTSLFKLGNDLYAGRVKPTDALNSVTAFLHYYAPEADFARELGVVGDWYGWYGLKYFLYEYEEHLARGRAVQLPWDRLAKADKKDSIEHVLPQTATDAYWTSRWSAEAMKLHVHDIGNLCLTFDNSVYGNKRFPSKKGSPGAGACYANSNMFMERHMATYADWTPAECAARRAAIVAWALARWKVETVSVPATDAEVLEDDEEEQ